MPNQTLVNNDELEKIEAKMNLLEKQNLQLSDDMHGKISIFAGGSAENLIQYQLDLSEEKEKIDHLLRGHVIKRDKDGNEYWDEPTDPAQKSLTTYGVERLMNIINFYLSRNIILSSYNVDQINEKMLDIGFEISDAIFLEYEYIFYKPSYKELITRDREKIRNLIRSSFTEDMARRRIMRVLYSYEIERENIYKKNLKQYPLICRMLIDAIHSAYNRALGGEERSSLRKVMSVNQNQSDNFNINPRQNNNIQKKRSVWNPLSW